MSRASQSWLVSTGGLQTAATATGVGNNFDVEGYATVLFNIRGTFVGTITFEGTSDDTNWDSINATKSGTNGVTAATATTTGIYRASVSGFKTIRANITAYTSGSITVNARAVGQPNIPHILSVSNPDGSNISGATGASAGQVQGNVAAASTDSGNPLKMGGLFSTSPPTLTNGQRGDVLLNSSGGQVVQIYTGNTNLTQSSDTNQDALPAAVFTFTVANRNYLFNNGTSWDRERANFDTASLITATGATTSQTGADQTNYSSHGVKVVLDMTTVGTGSVTLTIQGKDAASGKYYTILAGAAVVANSTNVYTVFPGAPATANVSANDVLPRVWRVITTANNANATTYTVGASVLR